ncbi:MAG: hypothetical protein V9E85_00800 [Candidatus Nanopelagicales bacterium]
MKFVALGADDRSRRRQPRHLKHLNASGVTDDVTHFPQCDLPYRAVVSAVVDHHNLLADTE